MRGRYRPYLSLWEGSEKDHNGGAEGREKVTGVVSPFPSPRMIPDRSSSSRVPLRRFAPWTAPGRSEGMAVYKGKGGGEPWAAEGESLVR